MGLVFMLDACEQNQRLTRLKSTEGPLPRLHNGTNFQKMMREIWFKCSYKGGRQLRALLPARALCSLRSQVAARHRRDVEWVRQADFYRRRGGDNTVWCWMLAELVGWSAAPVARLMCRVLALGERDAAPGCWKASDCGGTWVLNSRIRFRGKTRKGRKSKYLRWKG